MRCTCATVYIVVFGFTLLQCTLYASAQIVRPAGTSDYSYGYGGIDSRGPYGGAGGNGRYYVGGVDDRGRAFGYGADGQGRAIGEAGYNGGYMGQPGYGGGYSRYPNQYGSYGYGYYNAASTIANSLCLFLTLGFVILHAVWKL